MGIGASVLFTLGVLPNVTMFISMIIYLSWKEIGRKFFQLQFDNIILEAVPLFLYVSSLREC